MPHFSGHYRHRGSGFGALAAGIGRVALHLALRLNLPTAKRIGKELLKQSLSEILDVVGNKKHLNIIKEHNFKNCYKNRQEALGELLCIGGNQYEASQLHSLFSDCTVSANGLKISNVNGNYAHENFIET